MRLSQERPPGGECTLVVILSCQVPVFMRRAEFEGYLVHLEKSEATWCGREVDMTLW